MSSLLFVDLAFYLTMMLAAIATASAINFFWPFYRRLTTANNSRLESLDGFRGLLATGVVVHHLGTRGAVWTWAHKGEGLLEFLGAGAVAFFFMTTGFLFWSRAIDGRLSALPLLISRFWRVMPLYLFSTLLVVLAVFSITDWQVRDNPLMLSLSLFQWSCGGLFGAPKINSVDAVTINPVTWTLQYEWIFYLTLPLLAVMVKPSRFVFLVCLTLAALAAAKFCQAKALTSPLAVSSSFLCGMAAAYGVRIPIVRQVFGSNHFAWCLVPLLAVALLAADTWNKTTANVFLLPVFLSVACGNTALGLLSRPWALLLGHISYSIYLLHCIVLSQALRIPAVAAAAGNGQGPSVLVAAAIVVAVVLVSSLTYRFIEHPFLRSSRPKSAPAPGSLSQHAA